MRYFSILLSVLLSLVLFYFNINLHTEHTSKQETQSDILLQLNFLEDQLHNKNLGMEMQNLFPEGEVFTNVLYGLSWCELAMSDPENDSLKNKAIKEALFAYNTIDQKKVKSIFPSFLKPDHGAFYSGWRNYLLSKILLLDTTFTNAGQYIEKYKMQSQDIANTYDSSRVTYLESYAMQTWPADNFIAIGSLANYDKLFPSKYNHVIKKWMEKVKSELDPETMMIPHAAEFHPDGGISYEIMTRGSSTTLILRMLIDIDPYFGKEQYELFKENFVETTFGLPSVREFPKGISAFGDIDSGPVFFGVGSAATIVSIGTFAAYGDYDKFLNQYKTINAFGFTTITEDQKMYLDGILPIADAFIAWGRASALNFSENEYEHEYSYGYKFHIYSLIILVLIWGYQLKFNLNFKRKDY